MTKPDPFRYFKTNRKIIRLAVMLYVRFPLSLRNVEDLMRERGIDVSHEAVLFWWHRFGPMCANETKKRRVEGMKSSRWRWHLDEMFVKINGERHYLWRAVDHEGEGGGLHELDLSRVYIKWDSKPQVCIMNSIV